MELHVRTCAYDLAIPPAKRNRMAVPHGNRLAIAGCGAPADLTAGVQSDVIHNLRTSWPPQSNISDSPVLADEIPEKEDLNLTISRERLRIAHRCHASHFIVVDRIGYSPCGSRIRACSGLRVVLIAARPRGRRLGPDARA